MAGFQAILSDAIHLPIAERIQLIEALWETVPPDAEASVSPAWREEIRRRSDEYDRGAEQTTSWEEIRKAAIARAQLNASR